MPSRPQRPRRASSTPHNEVANAFAGNTKDIQSNNQALKHNIELRTKNTKAIGQEAVALKDLGQVQGKAARSVAELGEAQDSIDKNTKSSSKLMKENTEHVKKFEKVMKGVRGAIELANVGWKAYLLTQYDNIQAARLMSDVMGKGLAKGAEAANRQIKEMGYAYGDLRSQISGYNGLANEFMKDWEEALGDTNSIIKTFGMDIHKIGKQGRKDLIDLQKHMYAAEVATGIPLSEQLENMSHAVRHVGITTKQYQEDFETLANMPSTMADDLKETNPELRKYASFVAKDLVKAVQDLIKQHDLEHLSLKRLGTAYVALERTAAKYGQTQKQAQEFSGKVIGGLMGKSSGTSLNVQDWLSGNKMTGQLRDIEKKGFKKGDKDLKGKDAVRAYLEEQFKGTGKEGNILKGAVDTMMETYTQGNQLNTGWVSQQMAGTKGGMKSRLQAGFEHGDFKSLLQGSTGIEGIQRVATDVLGIKDLTNEQANVLRKLSSEEGFDAEKLADRLTREMGAGGKFSADQLKGASAQTQEANLPKRLELMAKNTAGLSANAVDLAKQTLGVMSDVADAVGAKGGAVGMSLAAGFTAGAFLVQTIDKDEQERLAAEKERKEKEEAAVKALLESSKQLRLASKELADFDKVTEEGKAKGMSKGEIEGRGESRKEIEKKIETLKAEDAKKLEEAKSIKEEAKKEEKQSSVWGSLKKGNFMDAARSAANDIQGDTEGGLGSRLWSNKGKIALAANGGPIGLGISALSTIGSMMLSDSDEKKSAQASRKVTQRWLGDEIEKREAPKPHALGLDRVPYDEYLALLHQDEAVLTPEEAEGWRKNKVPTRAMEPAAATGRGGGQASRGGSGGGYASDSSSVEPGKLKGVMSYTNNNLVITIDKAQEAVVQLLSKIETGKITERI